MYFYDSLVQRIRMKLHFPLPRKNCLEPIHPLSQNVSSPLEPRQQEVLEDTGTA